MIFHVLYLQEQTTEDVVMLNGFGTIVNSLSKRVKPYLPQICGTILWRLNNKSAKVRQQAADLISRIAVVMKTCQEEKLMGHLGVRFNIISRLRVICFEEPPLPFPRRWELFLTGVMGRIGCGGGGLDVHSIYTKLSCYHQLSEKKTPKNS